MLEVEESVAKACKRKDAFCGMTPFGCILKMDVSCIQSVLGELQGTCEGIYPEGKR